MPLSDDQKAMLRLLAQREQGYEDLAALMGLSVDEVRVKVKDALAQLEEEGKPAPSLPAEPPEPAVPTPVEPAPEPVVTPPQSEPAPPVVPVEPAAPAPKPPAPAAKRTPPPRPKISLPGGGAKAAIAAGVAVVVLVIVILLVGGSGGGSGDTSTSASASGEGTTAEETASNASSNSQKITQAVLTATDGSDAKGVAVFGRVKNSLALQIEATGLAPTTKDQSYAVWLAQSPQKMLPLATTAVGKSGKIGAQVEVPTEVLGYLAKGTFTKIVISLTDNAALKAALTKATSEKKAPIYTGTEVLSGTVTGPIVGAANKAKE